MLLAKKEESTNVKPISPGVHLAICYAVIDLGVQFSKLWQKERHKILLIWETDEEMITVDGEIKPKLISKEYVLSLHEKSDLYKTLISWRGQAFTPEEIALGFNVEELIGLPCLLNIVNVEKNGATYANISGVTPLMKEQAIPTIVNKPIFFELSIDTLNQIDNLPGWIANKIKDSVTYKKLKKEKENGKS